MRPRKKTEGFNLAFLDIMSCGLGAVILIFMLVKYQTNTSIVEIGRLTEDIQALELAKQDAMNKLEDIEQQLVQDAEQQRQHQQRIAKLNVALKAQLKKSAQTSNTVTKLQSELKDIQVKKPETVIENTQINEENYLLGLKIEGKKIAILIDSSASMTDEKLLNIIKTKNSSIQEKQQSKKWNRAKRIIEWILVRLPKDSEVIVVSFSEQAQELGGSGWKRASDSPALSNIIAGLHKLVPTGATNLQIGLKQVYAYKPSNLYLVTDGLPTKGESRYKSLNPFASCSSLTGNAKIISGQCRIKLFQQTIAEEAKLGTQVNIILLPIEGDPDAINQYWAWAASSGGLVISPAASWP